MLADNLINCFCVADLKFLRSSVFYRSANNACLENHLSNSQSGNLLGCKKFSTPGLAGITSTQPSTAVQHMLFPRLEFWKCETLKNIYLPTLWKALNLQHIQFAVISHHSQGSRSLEILEAHRLLRALLAVWSFRLLLPLNGHIPSI